LKINFEGVAFLFFPLPFPSFLYQIFIKHLLCFQALIWAGEIVLKKTDKLPAVLEMTFWHA
jgi:hypothetical protein